MREAGNFTPVLMLTAKNLPEDVVTGLEAGADDYLAKPFDLPVLLARVKGLIRRRDWTRAGDRALEHARIGDAEVDFRGFEIRRPEETVRLTLLEAMLLKLLVQNRGQVVSKGEILEKVWNLNPETETRAVDNFVDAAPAPPGRRPALAAAPGDRPRRRLPADRGRRGGGLASGLRRFGCGLREHHCARSGCSLRALSIPRDRS